MRRTKGLNSSGSHHCASLISSGAVDKTSDWSFNAEDGDKLLGSKGDDWTSYSQWFLGEDTTATDQTKARYKYPFGKDGKVFRSALVAIRSRASQNNEDAVFSAAGHFIDEIDGKKSFKAAPSKRCYAKFVVKAVDEAQRTIQGIATTPTPDRVGDIVEPDGAEYNLPIPFLWQHDCEQPVGQVTAAKITADGIPVTIQMATIDEPGTLKDRLDEAWQSIKIGLVRGLSIGFNPTEYSFMEDTYGYRYIKWEWLELSAVTIPANADASITSIKSMDRKLLVASGRKEHRPVVRFAASGKTKSKLGATQVKISEQIAALKNERSIKVARLNEIQEKAGAAGRSKDASEAEEFGTLKAEIKTIDGELTDLQELEAMNVTKATRITPTEDDDEPEVAGSKQRGNKGVPGVQTIAISKTLEKGILFARYVKCVGAAKGNAEDAMHFAKEHYPDTPQISRVLKARLMGAALTDAVMKTAVAGGTTSDATWAGPLVEYTQFAGDFVEFLRPQTIIGKFGVGNIPSLRRVPFNIHIRGQTSGGAGYWVGQGKPKPLTKFDFEDIYLPWAKVANIAVLTEELLRFSNPAADALVRDGMAGSLIERLDIDFVDPTKVISAGVSPASITNGVTPIHSSGATAADVRADIASALTKFIDANISPTTAVWIMPAIIALRLSLLRNAFGQKEFPDITMNGGMLEGIPVITSQYVPMDTAGATVVLANAADIWLSDDGQVVIDASREASLQMLDNPTNAASDGTATTMVSMFQTNSVAMRAERFINWKKRRDNAVAVLDQVIWTGG